MTKEKKWRWLGGLTAGIILLLPILWLSASADTDAAPQQKKRQNLMQVPQFKGPDNAGGPIVPKVPDPAIPAAAILPVPPPYAPAPVAINFGMTGLVVYSNTNGLALIDPGKKIISEIFCNLPYDPLKGGPLGSEGGGRFDVAFTHDGKQALISNFGDSKVFFVDLRSGTPVVSGMVKTGYFAEDIAIDPTDKWALVADGGFSKKIARINIATKTWLSSNYHLPAEYIVVDDPADPDYPGYYQDRYANSIDIAADGRTVIVTDYFVGKAHVLLLDPATGALSTEQTVELWKYGTDETAAWPFLYRPVNSAISPDGKTVLIANVVRSATYQEWEDEVPDAFFEGCNVAVLKVDRPGHVVRMPDLIMPWAVNGGQSIVFSRDGKKAFYETFNADELQDFSDNYEEGEYFAGQEIQVISVRGAGLVSHTGTIHTPSWRGTSQLFGVDTMATSPDGDYLYVTNPTLSGASPIIDVINLNTMSHVKQIGTPTNYPDPTPVPGDFIDWVLPVGIAFPEGPVDLSLNMSVDKSSPAVGDTVTFIVKIKNNGPGVGFDIRVATDLPAGLTLLSASVSFGTFYESLGQWKLLKLGLDKNYETLTLKARVNSKGTITSKASIKTQNAYDPRGGNDRSSVTIIVN